MIDAWLEALKAAFAATGATAAIEAIWENLAVEPSEEEYAHGVAWWEQPVVADLPESFGIGVPEDAARALAGEDDAVERLLNGAAAMLADLMPDASAVARRERPPVGGTIFAIRLTKDGEPAGRIWAAVSSELETRLQAPSVPPPPVRDEPLATPERRRTMDVLLDVELPIRISLGRNRLMLKDVLKLTTGSVLELNRALSDPVDVVVNNCIVARGELVVVEGNYGIRIQEINDRNRRAASEPGHAA